MSTVKVFAPAAGFEGEVAGVQFKEGQGEVERGTPAYQYFRTSGYSFGEPGEPPVSPEPVDPRDLGDGTQPVGTRLRDAAVDPRPEDFLPPTNAGQANPHGPLVVAPGLHATPPGPIAPGEVSKDPVLQQLVETQLAEQVLVEGQDVKRVTAEPVEAEADLPSEPPAKSATKPEWVAYADQVDDEDHEAMTKPQLIERYGQGAVGS